MISFLSAQDLVWHRGGAQEMLVERSGLPSAGQAPAGCWRCGHGALALVLPRGSWWPMPTSRRVLLTQPQMSVSLQSKHPARPSRSPMPLMCDERAAVESDLSSGPGSSMCSSWDLGQVTELPQASVSFKWQTRSACYVGGIFLSSFHVLAPLALSFPL